MALEGSEEHTAASASNRGSAAVPDAADIDLDAHLLPLLEALGHEPDLQSVLHVIVDRMAARFCLNQVLVVLYRAEDEFGYVVGRGETLLENLIVRVSDYEPLMRVAKERHSVVVHPMVGSALEKGQVWTPTPLEPGEQRNARLAPLIRKDEVVGAILLQANRSDADGPQLERLARLMSALTAISLGHALEQDLLLTERRALLRDKATAAKRVADLEAFETFFERAQDGIIVCDNEGIIRFVNTAAARILRSPAEKLRRRSFVNLLGDRYHEWARRHLTPSLGSNRGTGDGYIDLVVPVGEFDAMGRSAVHEVVISAAIRPMPDAHSSLVSFRDVTELREIETELWKTKDFLENLIQSSVDAIIACDTSGRIILFNRAAEQVLGYRAEDVVGTVDFNAMFSEGQASDILDRLRRTPEGRLGITRRELVDQGGDAIPVNMTAASIYEGDNEVAYVAIFTDLRERMRMEEKLNLVERKLRQSERRSVAIELAGVAAHELNQPLTSILGYAELLKRRLHTREKVTQTKEATEEREAINKPLRVIVAEVERIARIVRRLGEITDYKAKSYVGTSRILDLGPSVDTSSEENPAKETES